jgi:oxygen-independent coproporphyrinogen-3 oxidase
MRSERAQALHAAEERVGQLRRFKQLGLAPLAGDFFVTVAYPPVSSYPRLSDAEFLKGYVPPSDGAFGVYAHIPFCDRHCVFCHVPVLSQPAPEDISRYLSALEREMEVYLRQLGRDKIKPRSILVGGGTPSDLEPRALDRFLKFFTSRLETDPATQFSVDVEPKSLAGERGRQRLEIMKSYGVNRICIGVDSFEDSLLRHMNRRYTAAEAVHVVRLCQEMGFAVNIEFIFGYPGQTMDDWLASMEQALALEADEIQLYRLRVVPYKGYEGTITKQYEKDPFLFPSDEETVRLKQAAHSLLRGLGYDEHLNRVFSKDPGTYSHYSKGLSGTLDDTIAFGQSARTSFHDRFGVNALDFAEYHASIEQGRLPVAFGKIRSRDEQLRWALILPLISCSVDKAAYQRLTGESLDGLFRPKIGRLKELDLIEEDARELKLTRTGRFFASEIGYQFYHPSLVPFPPTAFAEAELNPYNDPDP